MSFINTNDYLPYGPIPVDEPVQDEKTVDLSDYINHNVIDENFMDNVMKTTINAIYRMYLLEHQRRVISTIKVDSNGVAKPKFLNMIGGTIGDMISKFISDMKRIMMSTRAQYINIEPSILKASRYIWNYPETKEIDTSEFMVNIISSVASDYASDNSLQPTAFSVATIRGNYSYAKIPMDMYFLYTLRRHLPKLIESGLVPRRVDISSIYAYNNNEDIVSFVKHQMVTEFMSELLKRIEQIIPDFPQEIIRQFFVSRDWKDSRYHNVVYYGMKLDNPNIWSIKGKLGSGTYGNIYEICRMLDCEYVMKFQSGDNFSAESSDREVDIMNKAHDIGVSPKIVAYYVSPEYSLIIMKKLKTTLHEVIEQYRDMSDMEYENLMDNVVDLIEKLHEGGIVHCDLHFGNIMLDTKFSDVRRKLTSGVKLSELELIDFGFASSVATGARGYVPAGSGRDAKHPAAFSFGKRALSRRTGHLDEEMDDISKRIYFYYDVGIIEKLRKFGCDMDGIDITSNLVPILKFYDYSKLLRSIQKYKRKAERAVKRIIEKQVELSRITKCCAGQNIKRPIVNLGMEGFAMDSILKGIKAVEEEKNNKLNVFFDRMLGPSLYFILLPKGGGFKRTLLNKLYEFMKGVTKEQSLIILKAINIVEKGNWELLDDPNPVFQKIKKEWFTA
jgi:Protein kinase domain